MKQKKRGRPMQMTNRRLQKLLVQRLEKILMHDPNREPLYKLYKSIGISLTCLNSFMKMTRNTSLMQLMKIQKYIFEKEKEFGL
jgi:hypothetical protein